MKKLLIIILILKCSFLAKSQDISVSIHASQKFNLKDDRSFIGSYMGNYIFFYINKEGKYDELRLEYYDSKLTLLNSIKLDLFTTINSSGKTKYVFDKVFLLKDKIRFLVSEFDKSKDETYLHCFTVNPLDATLIDFKTLDTVSIKGLNIMLNRYSLHEICFAKDSSKIGLIRYKDYAENNFGNISTSGKQIQFDKKDSFHTKVYDADFSLIDKKSLLFPFKTDLYHKKNTIISTEGNIYIYSSFTSSIPTAGKKYFTYIGCKEPGYKTYEFDKKGRFTDIQLKENNKNEVMAIALYGSTSLSKIEGFFIAKITKDRLINEQTILFEKTFYENLAKYSVKKIKPYISYVEVKDIYFSDKNDAIFCIEEKYTDKISGKALFFSYDQYLKLNWSASIDKTQFETSIVNYYGYSSYVSNFNNNGLYVLFNDNPENANKGIKYKVKATKNYDKSVIQLVYINNQGELRAKALEYNPKLGSVLSTRQFGYNGNYNIVFTAKNHKSNTLKFYNVILK